MKKLSSYAVVLWSVIALTFMTGRALADRRVALVIGNAKYQKITKLTNPANDAPDIAEALLKLGFEVIMKTDIDKRGFDGAFKEFNRKAADADVALFYYAGHGMQFQKQNYLLPIEIGVEDSYDVEYDAIGMDTVLKAVNASKGVKIIILDACRDNPLDKLQANASRGVQAGTRGLARIDRTDGMLVAYATGADQTADDGTGKNSPFTEALVKRLNEPNLEVYALFRNVANDVYERTNKRQRPEVTSSLLNEFYLKLADTDSVVWTRIRDTQDPAVLANFIGKYPASPYARDAQFRLDNFEMIARLNDERARREQDRKDREQMLDEMRRAKEELLAERQAFEQRERERIEAEKQRASKLETERLESERKDAARREADRLAAEKREADKREVERLTAEKRALERRDAETREAARTQSDRIAAEKREAEKREADRLAAVKREADKLAAEKREADMREADRIAAEKKAEFEKLAREQADSAKREAARKAEEKRERDRIAAIQNDEARKAAELVAAQKQQAERLEAEQREAARKEAQRLAAAKASESEKLAREQLEAQRREADRAASEKKAEQERIRVAALQDADLKRQQAEAEKQRLAAVCARESDDVKRLASERSRTALDAFRAQAACPTTAVSIDKAIREIAAADARTCDADSKLLGKAGNKDLATLRTALDAMTCEKVQVEATGRIAKLEAEARKAEVGCAIESGKITEAKSAGADALAKLGDLQKTLNCERMRPVVADAIKELAALAPKAAEIDSRRQILEAQSELKRIGCYSGNLNGNMNNGTKSAVAKYFVKINAAAREVRFSDELIDELKRSGAEVCPAEPVITVTRPRPVREEPDEPVVRRRPQRDEPVAAKPKPVRQPVERVAREPRPAPAPKPVAAARPAPVRAPAPVASAPRINVIGVGF